MPPSAFPSASYTGGRHRALPARHPPAFATRSRRRVLAASQTASADAELKARRRAPSRSQVAAFSPLSIRFRAACRWFGYSHRGVLLRLHACGRTASVAHAQTLPRLFDLISQRKNYLSRGSCQRGRLRIREHARHRVRAKPLPPPFTRSPRPLGGPPRPSPAKTPAKKTEKPKSDRFVRSTAKIRPLTGGRPPRRPEPPETPKSQILGWGGGVGGRGYGG